ncbi:MAG: 2-amino-4-hydroxy-6-hydroxymethyldihydropteridine diphosphokinase [Comamonadaceae bacterium]|nr:MAG: 2-amino-4-hydroxy-6-hydroxymethyldihydropteridine diphosphokinase [Comamonadaceae bacterium]
MPDERREPVMAYIALGANLGDAPAALAAAIRSIGQLPATRVQSTSSIYRTSPIGVTGGVESGLGPDYFNAVAEIRTCLGAPDLLDALQHIEQLAGRERPYVNAPRTLDLDILLYGDARIDSPQLTVPHPRMSQRAFVLVPLAEIAPQAVAPFAVMSVRHQPIEKLGPLAG